jgi:hypothetical protein
LPIWEKQADGNAIENELSVKREVVSAMAKAGIAPELVYAFEKTGLLRSEANQDKMLPEDRAAWDDAIEEYQGLMKRTPKQ